jgi:general secretion pathway protein F
MRFELLGITQDGRIERLDLQAMDETGARAQALALGYSILTLHGRAKLSSIGRRRGGRFPVLLFSQELLVLLDAGLPLVVAIATLAEKERVPGVRTTLDGITATLRRGRTLSDALEQHPGTFTALYIATVRASERTSDLGPTLARYITYQSQIDAIRKRLINASIYPAILILAGGMVSLFLLLYVMPRFAKIYEERSTDLPWVSQLLLYWGQAVEGHAMLVTGALALLGVALWHIFRSRQIRAGMESLLWRLPVVGEQLKVYQLARFYRTIGMLLRGGLPLVAALKMGADLLHPVLRERLTRASLSISEGRTVSASMESNGLTTPVALRLLSVGEQSGNMGEMMDHIALFHDEEISRWVDWFTRLLEPVLMGVIGIVVGGIVILMYMPIFELAGSLK